MTGGLREYWELPEINRPEGANGNGEFGQDFRAGLAGVNQDMQVVTARGGQGDRQKLDANRQTLISAYQNAAPLGDATKNGQVMGAVAKVQQQTSDKVATINAGYEEWQKRQPAFDEALAKIGELEDAGNAKAPAYRQLSEAIQNRVNGGDFQNANTAFDQLQPKLDDLITQPNGPTPGMEGLDTGQVRADTAKEVADRLERGAKALWNWITKEGVSTIVIENWTSKVLRFNSKELLHRKEAEFVEHPPTEIMAAKGTNDPTKVTMSVKTKGKWIRSVTRADTSGFVVYEVADMYMEREVNKKKVQVIHKVRAAWKRKGEGEFDGEGTWTSLGGHKFEVQQVKDGTIFYRFTEEAPKPKPKTPTAPPEPTDVLFAQGKSDLLPEGRSKLQTFAEAASKYLAENSTAKIKVEGWASKVPYAGKPNIETSNENLSYQRAEAVFKHLTEVEKLPRDKIKWEGKGATSNFDAKLPEPNQRATIKVQ
jgi:outer membrane protein OmpA-like peptidoglycan-associated protein